MKEFNKICEDIKSLKIQGASNVAIAALKAYSLRPSKNSVRKLISLRPTEPCLRNALKFAELKRENIGFAIGHIETSKEVIAEAAAELINKKSLIYTHCHSSTAIESLINAKNSGKNIKVHCTETRPLYQGRITASELVKNNIDTTLFVDSAMRMAIRNADLILLGADAITSKLEIINKIGSELVAESAKEFNVPLYILTDSWKFDAKTLSGKEEKIENRNEKEVWKNKPKNLKIENPAFEIIKPEFVTGIISEFGILKPKQFVMKTIKEYPWMVEN